MINCKLIRMLSNHQNLRTDEVIGKITELPQVGHNLHLIGESIDPNKYYRDIQTSEIQTVQYNKNKEYIFTTNNSTYKLIVEE